jgi:Flp pilus assembly pilin Flp
MREVAGMAALFPHPPVYRWSPLARFPYGLSCPRERRPHRPRKENAMTKIQKSQKKKNRRGQGMTEYIIIVALIAIAAIGVITLFGNNIRKLFGMSADALAGSADVTMRATASSDQWETKHMKDFGENNAP